MRRVPSPRPEELDEEQAALYHSITGGPRGQGTQHFSMTEADGSLRGPFGLFLLAPGVGVGLDQMGTVLRFGTALPDRVREMAILLVAAHWRSAFEAEAHEPIGRSVGLTEDEIVALRGDRVPELADEVERAHMELAAAMVHDGDVSDELWDSAVPVVGVAAVEELAALVGHYASLALQMRVFRV